MNNYVSPLIPRSLSDKYKSLLPGTFRGTARKDRVFGDDNDNVLLGLGGDDYLAGSAGNDTIRGGSGSDFVTYRSNKEFYPRNGVSVNLSRNRGVDKYRNTDKLFNIENVEGTGERDLLIGDGKSNTLSGRDGNDKLNGLGGDDILYGGPGKDTLTGGRGADTFLYGYRPKDGIDVITDFETGTDKILLMADTFFYSKALGIETGVLSEKDFVIGSAPQVQDPSIVYNPSNGELSYQAPYYNVTIATLSTKPTLQASDIHISNFI